MTIRSTFLLSVVAALLLCGSSCVEIPSAFDIRTESELGPNTLDRVDDLNRLLAKGVEIGPETRALIEQLNETVDKGVKVGFTPEVLAQVDRLVGQIEKGLKVGLDDDTLTRVDDLVDTLRSAPDDWRATLTDIVKTLESSGTGLARSMSSEIKDVMAEADHHAKSTVAAVGLEGRCNVDFLGKRAKSTVDQLVGDSIIGKVVRILDKDFLTSPPPRPWVCQILPDEVELEKQGAYLVTKRPVVEITGFNFGHAQLEPWVELPNKTRWTEKDFSGVSAPATEYKVLLNLQGIDMRSLPAQSQLVLDWRSTSDTDAEMPQTRIPIMLPGGNRARFTVTVESADVYRGPSTDYRLIGKAPAGVCYTVLGRNDDRSWWQIEHPNGIGWVLATAGSRNEFEVDVATPPIRPPIAKFTFERHAADAATASLPMVLNAVEAVRLRRAETTQHPGAGLAAAPRELLATAGRLIPLLELQKDSASRSLPVWPPSSSDLALSGEPPLEVQFIDQSEGIVTSWRWSFGDGKRSNLSEPLHSYTEPGTYSVKLTVSNDEGSDEYISSKKIRVLEPLPAASFTASTKSGPAPLTVAFEDHSTESSSWKWSFGDGSRPSTERSPTHTYSRQGDYTVKLTVTNRYGSDELVREDYIRVGSTNLSVEINARPGRGRAPLRVALSAAVRNGEAKSHAWYFGDGEESSSTVPRHTFDFPGTYTIHLRVTDAYGNRAEDDLRIEVDAPNSTCEYTDRFLSGRNNTGKCKPGEAVGGLRCIGYYCTEKQLLCCRYAPDDDEANGQWTDYYLSEEVGPGHRERSAGGILGGMKCMNNYCGDMDLLWLRPNGVSLDGGGCSWSEWLDGDGSSARCSDGAFVHEIQCRSSYCQDIRFRCCPIGYSGRH